MNKATPVVQHSIPTIIGSVIALVILLLPRLAGAQSYTLAPTPVQTAFDNSGHVISGACIWTYLAGTTTAATTYRDNAGTAWTNPLQADSAGRFVVYLVAGTNYKFIYESSCTPPSHGTVLKTVDNISAVPAAAATVDITGTAGEAITAGHCVYLSDGSGSKTAGQWFNCDSTNTYASTLPEVGIATSAISSASAGTIRLAGAVSGLSSLSVGSEYFVGTSGALTSTAPLNRRHLGHADSATSLVLSGDPPPPTASAPLGFCGLRLTLTSGTAVTTSDVTAATNVYVTPVSGGQCAFYDGTSAWTLLTNTEVTVAVPATTSTPFDVFCRSASNVIACDTTNWTNDTTRATALTTQNGVLVKTGDTTRRYIGTGRTTAVSGQIEDSVAKRYVWNYYHRARRILRATDTTDSWTYTTNTYRQANAAAANQVDAVIGVAEVALDLTVIGLATSGSANQTFEISVGEDSTTTPLGTVYGQGSATTAGGTGAGSPMPTIARLTHYPAVGRHFYVWLERATGGGTVTWYGDNGDGNGWRAGMTGWIEG